MLKLHEPKASTSFQGGILTSKIKILLRQWLCKHNIISLVIYNKQNTYLKEVLQNIYILSNKDKLAM